MAGFKLNTDGDIGIDSSGKMLLLSTYQDLVKQRLQIKLKTFKGEWWLDTSYGISYRDTGDGKAIIGKGLTKSDVDAIFIAAIREDSDVRSIEYFKADYNSINRDYSLSFEVKVDDALLSSYSIATPAWEEETYTYNENLISSSCRISFQDWAETLHPIVHTYLPYGPRFGWLGALDTGLNTFGDNNLYMYPDYVVDGYVAY